MKKKLQQLLTNPLLSDSEIRIINECIQEAEDLSYLLPFLRLAPESFPLEWYPDLKSWEGYFDSVSHNKRMSMSCPAWESGWPRLTQDMREGIEYESPEGS